jgi:glycerol kinase
MLFNIKTLKWDKKLLEYFDIPESMLPEVKFSGDYYGEMNLSGCFIPITGIAGDQQASLFGQGCFKKGELKNTYGTGCFLLANIGDGFRLSEDGLITTPTATLKGDFGYALEGSVFSGGSVIQWLRDELKIIETAEETEKLALSVESTNGVYIVPAFTGLGAPYWDMFARGTITGITRGTNRSHITRAALESIAFQSKDVIDAMTRTLGVTPSSLKVDGGACANNFLMQFQADIIQKDVLRPAVKETTALGAAALAGLTVGFYDSQAQILDFQIIEKRFVPDMSKELASESCFAWKKAIRKTLKK